MKEKKGFSNTAVQKCSAFFTVPLSHPYMTTGKTIAVTRWIFGHILVFKMPMSFFACVQARPQWLSFCVSQHDHRRSLPSVDGLKTVAFNRTLGPTCARQACSLI